MSMHMPMHMSAHMSTHVSIPMSVNMSTHMSVNMSTHMSVNMSIPMSIPMPMPMSTHRICGLLVHAGVGAAPMAGPTSEERLGRGGDLLDQHCFPPRHGRASCEAERSGLCTCLYTLQYPCPCTCPFACLHTCRHTFPRRGCHFGYRHTHTRALDMPSAMPRSSYGAH